MAITIAQYNQTAKLLLNKEVDFTALKAMLLDNAAPFNGTHTTPDQVAGAGPTRAHEVYGNGWPQGGPTLTGVAVTTTTTNDATLDANDVAETASGGDIGPAYACLIYDSTSMKALWRIDFGQVQSAGNTTDFKIVWSGSGILQVLYEG